MKHVKIQRLRFPNYLSVKFWGHKRLFHEIATNFSNCCNFMKNFWVSPSIFLLLRNIFFLQQQKKIQINFFFSTKRICKKVNKKHVSPHLQYELYLIRIHHCYDVLYLDMKKQTRAINSDQNQDGWWTEEETVLRVKKYFDSVLRY